MTPRELTNEIVKILDKKKALDITAIKTEELTIVSDYFVIATGTSNTHVKSLADDLEYEMGKLGAAPEHIEGRATGWILLDFAACSSTCSRRISANTITSSAFGTTRSSLT